MGIPSHLRCDQVVEVASDYLERALAAAEAEQLEQHMLICADCETYVEQLRDMVEAASKLAEPAPSDEPTPASLLASFRRWKEGEPK